MTEIHRVDGQASARLRTAGVPPDDPPDHKAADQTSIRARSGVEADVVMNHSATLLPCGEAADPVLTWRFPAGQRWRPTVVSAVLWTVCGLVGAAPTPQFQVARTELTRLAPGVVRGALSTRSSPTRRIPFAVSGSP